MNGDLIPGSRLRLVTAVLLLVIFPGRMLAYPYDSLESVVRHEVTHLALECASRRRAVAAVVPCRRRDVGGQRLEALILVLAVVAFVAQRRRRARRRSRWDEEE